MLLARFRFSKWIAPCVAGLCHGRPRFRSRLPLRYLSGTGTGTGLMKTGAGTGTGHGTTSGAMFAGSSASGCTALVQSSAAEARLQHCVMYIYP